MKNVADWKPTKFELHRGRWRGSRDARELGVGSRLMCDLVAAAYQREMPRHTRGRLLDLGCGGVPLYGVYRPFVTEVTCVDWAAGAHVDLQCDLSQPLPFDAGRFDTIVLSDVLEHIPEPAALWHEIARVLSPGGKVVMNVPFYYSVHAHPHDYYRYTCFALERFVNRSGLALLTLQSFGGICEILADLIAKALSKAPVVGPPLAITVQAVAGAFVRTGLGAKVAQASSRHFPLGYFMVAQRPAA